MAENTLDKIAHSKTGQVLSWCPCCHVQFTETTLPTIEHIRGAKPFEMTPFMLFLRALDRLRPLLRQRVDAGRAALPSRHSGRGRGRRGHFRAVPGIELVDLQQPAVGLMSQLFPRAAGLSP